MAVATSTISSPSPGPIVDFIVNGEKRRLVRRLQVTINAMTKGGTSGFALEGWSKTKAAFRTMVYMEIKELAKEEAGSVIIDVNVNEAIHERGHTHKHLHIAMQAWQINPDPNGESRHAGNWLGFSVLELRCAGLGSLSRTYYRKQGKAANSLFPRFKWSMYESVSDADKVQLWFPAAKRVFYDKIPGAKKIILVASKAGKERNAPGGSKMIDVSVATLLQRAQCRLDTNVRFAFLNGCHTPTGVYLLQGGEFAKGLEIRSSHHAVLFLVFTHIFSKKLSISYSSNFVRPTHTRFGGPDSSFVPTKDADSKKRRGVTVPISLGELRKKHGVLPKDELEADNEVAAANANGGDTNGIHIDETLDDIMQARNEAQSSTPSNDGSDSLPDLANDAAEDEDTRRPPPFEGSMYKAKMNVVIGNAPCFQPKRLDPMPNTVMANMIPENGAVVEDSICLQNMPVPTKGFLL